MSALGGYFELELSPSKTSSYHHGAFEFNIGRNAFLFFLENITCTKVFVPYYTCDVIISTLKKAQINYDFYNIDEKLEPNFDYSLLGFDEYFLYTNYFGLKDDFIKRLSIKCQNVIIDNSQSFFSKPLNNQTTFYTARKFFGVADGAYLYANIPKDSYLTLKKGLSYNRFDFLLKRGDIGAEDAYSDFLNAERLINDLPVERMSNLTKKMLNSIDYRRVAETRIQNFTYLFEAFRQINEFVINWNGHQVPMFYPLLLSKPEIAGKLLAKKIYTPRFWNSVLDYVDEQSVEYMLSKNMIFLPIDQRYSKFDMQQIIKTVK